MPNQRKKGTKLIGAYVSAEFLAAVKRQAKKQGMTVADYVRQLIREEIQKKESKAEDHG